MQSRQRHEIRKRATAEQLPTHRAGHYSGIHPEDAPYLTDQRKRYPHNPLDLADDLDYPEERTRMPTSARRWVDTQGNQVIQQGNRRLVIHDEPPPRRRRRMHWSAIFGIGMTMMVILFISWTLISNWWTNHQLDATYGFPRTWQTDAVVGHSDSADHPSHFIFLNLSGHVIIIELPGGDVSHAKIYSGPTIFTNDAASVPVTGEFKDVNGDGKIDMIVHIQDQRIIYLNDGTQFKSQQ
jgi:hypothetical protein